MTKRTKKDEKILELQYTIAALENEIEAIQADYLRAVAYNSTVTAPDRARPTLLQRIKNRRPRYAADVAIDFWPLRDWFRLSFKRFHPGRYAQIVVGPIRAEFYES